MSLIIITTIGASTASAESSEDEDCLTVEQEPTARVRDHLCVEISFEKSVDISQSSRNPLIFSQSLRIFQLIPSRRM